MGNPDNPWKAGDIAWFVGITYGQAPKLCNLTVKTTRGPTEITATKWFSENGCRTTFAIGRLSKTPLEAWEKYRDQTAASWADHMQTFERERLATSKALDLAEKEIERLKLSEAQKV